MERRRLGEQGLVVSAMGLGCLSMSDFYRVPEESQAIATIHRAIALGVDLLDTADCYGPHTNERLVGKAIADRRDEVVLATKFGYNRDPDDGSWLFFSGRPEYVHESCDGSLTRLGIDHIDLYQFHGTYPDVPIEETVGAMGELVDAGKVRYIGICEADENEIERAHGSYPVSSLQTEYSLWTRHVEDGILDTTRRLGIGFIPYSPLSRGFLSGAIQSPEDFAPDDYRPTLPRFQGENFQKNLDLVALVEELAAKRGVTAAQLALAWVLNQGDDVVPIPGTGNPAHLEENLGAVGMRLSAEEIEQIEETSPADAVAGERYSEVDWSSKDDLLE
jgi:aryl-alcohol dehydrogenase-like predicted oxidoreductase